MARKNPTVKRIKSAKDLMLTKPEFHKTVTRRVQKYIVENNISLPEIADYLNMPYPQLYGVIYYRKTMDLAMYVALCRMFEVPLDYFVSDQFCV